MFVSIFAQETTHVVKKGDTLWDIAGIYYQNPFLWPYIWRANLTKINDPHWIYPDQEFVIPPAPEEAIGEVPAPPTPMPAPTPAPESVAVPPEEVVMPTPPPPSKPAAEVISVVSPEERVFSEEMIHRAGFILEDDLPYWGKIIGTEPAATKHITTFRKIYIDRATDVKAGDILTIYRPGHVVTHPKTGRRLGKEIIVLGKAEIEEVGPDGSRCKVIASYDIIKKGDFVTPYEPILAPEKVTLIPTEKDIEGYVVEVKNKDILTPSNIFAYVDQGEDAGIAVGDIFDVYEKREVEGKKMPDFNIARIQIVSVFKNASIGLLLVQRETSVVKRGMHCRLSMEVR